MSIKAILFSLGCVLAWFVLLPVVVIGGGLSLLLYAILGELGAAISRMCGTLQPKLTVTSANAPKSKSS